MNAVKPTPFTTPDGVERQLRFTLGARRRIQDAFGGLAIKDVLDKYDAAAFPEILHALLHDPEGNPPPFSVQHLAENLSASDSPEIMGAIIAAMSNGRVEKNEAEALIQQAMRVSATGSTSGPSGVSASDSPIEISGGDSSNAKSEHSPSSTESENAEPIIAPV